MGRSPTPVGPTFGGQQVYLNPPGPVQAGARALFGGGGGIDGSSPLTAPPGPVSQSVTSSYYGPYAPNYSPPGRPPTGYAAPGGRPLVAPGETYLGRPREPGGYPVQNNTSPQTLLDLLKVTDADLLEVQKQIGNLSPVDMGTDAGQMLFKRLSDLEARRAAIIEAVDQRAYAEGNDKWARDVQIWNTNYQLASLNQAQTFQNQDIAQRANEFAANYGLGVAQFNEGVRQFDIGLQDAWKRLEAEQGFRASESDKDRGFQSEQLATQLGFQAQESAKGREHQTSERVASQGFAAGENKADRDLSVWQTITSQEFQAAQNKYDRDAEMRIAEMNNAIQQGRLDLERANAEFDRWAQTRQIELQERAEANAQRRFSEQMAQEREFQRQNLGLDVMKEEAADKREGQRFGQQERQFGATFGQNERQFSQEFGLKRRQGALTGLLDLVRQGYATSGQPEMQVGGGPGGSIAQIMESFGGGPASPTGYYKPQAPTAALNPLMEDINAPAPEIQSYQPAQWQDTSSVFDQFRRQYLGA